MPNLSKAPAALSAEERRQLLSETEAELRQLHDQIAALHDRVRPLAKLADELRRLDDDDLVAGLAPAAVFDDPDLLRTLAQREWNHGRGSRPLNDFLATAFSGLAAGIAGFEREVADDYATVTRMMPKLYLSYRQDVTELAAALRRIYPALAVDGVMKVDILEHTCSEYGSWHLEMPTASTATLYRDRREDRAGELDDVLEHVARHHWGTDVPR